MGTPPTIEFASLGMADSLILMVLALVVFGPRRLPQIGRQIGKLMYEFRKASNDFKFQMEEELRSAEDADRRKKEEEERLRTPALAPPAPAMIEPAAPPAAEGLYSDPPMTAPATQVEESYPRIQPPSTGEQVSAARPNSTVAAEVAAEANIGSDAAPSALPDEPNSDPVPPVTEPAGHHG